MNETESDWLPTRRSLLTRLRAHDDAAGWQEFFDTYSQLIYGVARKAGLADPEAQDVVQETVIAAARKLPEFRFDPAKGSFKSWLLLITWRRINDLRRRQYREPEFVTPPELATGRTDTLERQPDPATNELESLWESEWEKNLLAAALARVRRQVDPKQFQIFDCHVLKEWPVAEVTRALGISAGQVYLAKHRVGLLVQREVNRLRDQLL